MIEREPSSPTETAVPDDDSGSGLPPFPRRLLTLSLAFNLLALELLVLLWDSSIATFLEMTTSFYAWVSSLLGVLLALMFGLAAARALQSSFEGRQPRGMWLILSGAFLTLASVGCPACGAPIPSLMGIEGGLRAFPLQGLELKLLAGALLGLALWSQRRKPSLERSEPEAEPEGVPRPAPSGSVRALRPLAVVGAVLALFYLLPQVPTGAGLNFSSAAGRAALWGLGLEGGSQVVALLEDVLPGDGYTLPVAYGDLGPRMIEAGAIDAEAFAAVYERAGAPLTALQQEILLQGSTQPIVVDRENAHFLLNFFWALGLVNRNPILEKGPMMVYAEGQIERFASTGGWTIGRRTPGELYASVPIVELTPEQQERLERVASMVYRPCCNNPTIFPDCNHGMAMLGMLELMASQDASEEAMFEAARYLNAFWFPQQALEVAFYLQASQGIALSEIDSRRLVGPETFSASGFRSAHAWLSERGLLQRAPTQGGSCGV